MTITRIGRLVAVALVASLACFGGCQTAPETTTDGAVENGVVYSNGLAYREGYALPKLVDSPLSMSCSAPEVITLGSRLSLEVRVRNDGDKPAGLRGFNTAETSLLKVYLDGHEVPKTTMGEKRLINEDRFPWRLVENEGSSPSNELNPNQSFSYIIAVNDYYEISKPGIYLLIVKRRYFDPKLGAFSRLVSGAVVRVGQPSMP